jgi:excisionase family DNA binding protein
MSQMSTGLSRQEKRAQGGAPLAVPPREAGRLLSLSMSRVYQLMRDGELQSYEHGRARRIPVASIHTYIARRLADTAGKWRQITPQPPRRLSKAWERA